ncbi:hypothetical protein DIQ79_13125 [Mycolicibacterium smegmatis]|uniref:Uncharacterized protein n=1 Tax=Mycolicibacterium smegmatis (strain ATCC 700084 / mc(2)155) TaxID=246196 RepID=A0QRF6_MYCS2|nr:hypothetical protein MSMEG_1099 [Mycolicibacterium smegmatis MC2 155]TBM46528.1 hypothetical protein DIQ86_12610 [Mycolicibacterium smegmatis]TBH45877.1 hypothetical protein EYS45_11135 [Mycolicibacterium smegmatis MC2 155]TBM51334.1 hypothetical protein DIQ85_12600 [Mycolicibacterium smegmatis]TBM62140.1 hypothetical protein DIQ83_13535 [Mycolicibacterium smegmatis]
MARRTGGESGRRRAGGRGTLNVCGRLPGGPLNRREAPTRHGWHGSLVTAMTPPGCTTVSCVPVVIGCAHAVAPWVHEVSWTASVNAADTSAPNTAHSAAS